MPEVITAQSTPDLDDWGWDTYWNCEQWMQWHTELKNAFGLEQANYEFITWFQSATMGAASYDCRTTNSAFRQYARDNGFYDALYQGIGILAQPIGAGVELIGGAGDVLHSVVEGAEKIAESLKDILPILLIIAAVLVVIYLITKVRAIA